MKKVAVVGAGPAGLVVIKYCIANGFECDVYEQKGFLGGTWYTDKDGENEEENIIYTTLYKGVKTNIPKEVMMYPDYPYPLKETRSYLSAVEAFNYFKGYADTFNLHPYINYRRCVLNISTNVNDTWSVTTKNLTTKVVETVVYDYVFICNGHLWYPDMPQFPGRYTFKGTQIHSFKYYEPSGYKDRRVLVVGSRSSARDIVHYISLVANHVSIKPEGLCFVAFGEKVSSKPVIKELREHHSVVFEDGTEEIIDDIVYCTGYDYSYPFLSRDCGITIEDKHVNPLYLHMVNINHPTMFFIGVPFLVCTLPMFNLQVRFCIEVMKQNFKLPSKGLMLEDLDDEIKEKDKLNVPRWQIHRMGKFQEQYWAKVAQIASIKPLPPVLCRIYEESRKQRLLDRCYRIIDDENFEIYYP
ncbi:LOW QUALITY PROTEIN: dimethylaniline monooxygenase [N-oxide-forming] 3-like [Photinus pyralis]|uniref:LOW QUALITY PROTEIN: dimethylaniline monooxygenase [N-oxide-forming] 3-like n=1 Tax=Photinus pyralis TaxID=7054 RepID=UPI0012674A7E|nr:LOW QUALITY PROTEIN: dimethylaniline monooxygenase [N-oxide-forming] 3-like [Photinus pyralis]